MNDWLREHLACPRDKSRLAFHSELTCEQGHTYSKNNGIPIMLLEDVEPTHAVCVESLQQPALSDDIPDTHDGASGAVDPYVQKMVGHRCGCMYRPLVEEGLSRYPIPEIRLPRGDGRRLLDVGCGWGRWSISAAQRGYAVAGIDPSLDDIRAARRVAGQFGLPNDYVVGDSRYLPFADESFDAVFSYGVLMHFAREDVRLTLREIKRVLKPNGRSLIQMPPLFGVRNLYAQARRGFREARENEVRYWKVSELTRMFEALIGPTSLDVDSFLYTLAQPTDADLLPRRYRPLFPISRAIEKATSRVRPLLKVADSVYVTSTRAA